MNTKLADETSTHWVRCGTCGQDLGDYRPYFAQEHLKQFPQHNNFEVVSRKSKVGVGQTLAK